MTEINIRDLFCYDKDSIVIFLHILKENEFKIVIPRKIIEVEPVELTGMVEYDAAAYFGQLLSNIADRFSYYVPAPVSTAPFHFMATIRDINAFSDLLYLIAQVFNPGPVENDLFVDFHVDANIFFDRYFNGDETAYSCGLIVMANKLQEGDEQYAILPVKAKSIINTADCRNYSNAALYVHLLEQRTNEFEIVIPRPAEPDLVLYDFLNAAYAGQLISETANNFAYFVPSPQSGEAFYFQVTVYDFERFTDTLYLVIQGFDFGTDCCEEFEYKAALFLEDAYKEDSDCKTWGLLELALQLMCDQ